MPYATIEDVHAEIVREACEIANQDPWVFETFGGPVFIPGPARSWSFVITWPENISHSSPEIIEQLHIKGKQALAAAIKVKKEKFVGLIVGLAKRNENYFESFER